MLCTPQVANTFASPDAFMTLKSHSNMHNMLSRKVSHQLLTKEDTLLVPAFFKDGWITSIFPSASARNDLFHLSSFNQNPLPNMKSLYVGQWMVISILSQLWANLRMFGCLWKKARVNIVLPCAHSASPIVLLRWLLQFVSSTVHVSSPLCATDFQGSQGLCVNSATPRNSWSDGHVQCTAACYTYAAQSTPLGGLLSARLRCCCPN